MTDVSADEVARMSVAAKPVQQNLMNNRPPVVTGGTSGGSSSGVGAPMAPVTGSREVPQRGSGQWMSSTATLASTGLVSGRTRTWCTNTWSGFHGSVLPVLLDKDDHAVWPTNPESAKHQYGVDGTFFSGDDRTDAWSNQVPANLAKLGVKLQLIQYLDPKNMLLRDIGIAGKAIGEIIGIITKAGGL